MNIARKVIGTFFRLINEVGVTLRIIKDAIHAAPEETKETNERGLSPNSSDIESLRKNLIALQTEHPGNDALIH
ncbi:MAG: hypothetical protein LR017_02135 [Candidatus Pacebacteria bacterium]|nr:hypothetical protein [Candidatus Paceibacterota bacterium]